MPAADPGAVLAKADRVDLAGWFKSRAEEAHLETGPMHASAVALGPRYTGHVFWSVKEPLSGAFLPTVEIVLIPDPKPWAAAAYLGFGGWNHCPEPAIHVALMHAWYTRWGAEPFAFIDGVQAEMNVPRPPQSVADAMAAGQEQYLYAYDNVEQGDPDVDTREKYASTLIGFHSWQFWWD